MVETKTFTGIVLGVVGVLILFSGSWAGASIAPDAALCQDYLRHVHPYSAVAHGEANVRKHPLYERLVEVARHLGVEVVWVKSVADETHIKLGPDETIEGYFEDERNRVLLDHKIATLATLVHELRHAEQLGTSHRPVGTGIDLAIQVASRAAELFETAIQNDPSIPADRKKLVLALEYKLIVNSSEISAHYHDILILIRAKAWDEARDSLHYRKLYRRQFVRARRRLGELGMSSRFSFIEELGRAVDKHYFSENTRAVMSITSPTATIQSSGNQ